MKLKKIKNIAKILLIILLYVFIANTFIVNVYGSNYGGNANNKNYDVENFIDGYRKAENKNDYIKQYINDKGITNIEEFTRDISSAKSNVAPGLQSTYTQAINDVNNYSSNNQTSTPSQGTENTGSSNNNNGSSESGSNYGGNSNSKNYNVESFINGYRNATDKSEYVEDYINDKGITDIEEFTRDLSSARSNVASGLQSTYTQAINDVNNYSSNNQNNTPSQGTGNTGTSNNGGGGTGTPQVSGGITGFEDWNDQAQGFLDRGKEGEKITIQDAIASFVPIGRILVGIASIVLVAVGGIFGVRYMISGANEKAQMKEKLIYYVIAIVLVYGAVGIFTIVVNVMNNILA